MSGKMVLEVSTAGMVKMLKEAVEAATSQVEEATKRAREGWMLVEKLRGTENEEAAIEQAEARDETVVMATQQLGSFLDQLRLAEEALATEEGKAKKVWS